MDNEENKIKIHNAEIVSSSDHKKTGSPLGKFVGGIIKAGSVVGTLLKSKKVQRGLVFVLRAVMKEGVARISERSPRERSETEVLKMPRGDGTGPFGGGGPGSGRGSGGRGRGGGNRQGSGPGGYCVCPSCGRQVSHQVGVPCYSVKCPDCGAQMVKG